MPENNDVHNKTARHHRVLELLMHQENQLCPVATSDNGPGRTGERNLNRTMHRDQHSLRGRSIGSADRYSDIAGAIPRVTLPHLGMRNSDHTTFKNPNC